MDLLTAFPYIGIIVLIIFNVILVMNREIKVDESDHTINH